MFFGSKYESNIQNVGQKNNFARVCEIGRRLQMGEIRHLYYRQRAAGCVCVDGDACFGLT